MSYTGADNDWDEPQPDHNYASPGSNYQEGYPPQSYDGYNYFQNPPDQNNQFNNPQFQGSRSQSFGYNANFGGQNQFQSYDPSGMQPNPSYQRHYSMHQPGVAPVQPEPVDNNKPPFGSDMYDFNTEDNYTISPFQGPPGQQDTYGFGTPVPADMANNVPGMVESQNPAPLGFEPKLLHTKSEVKDTKKRRKSSGLDLLDEIGQFNEHVDKQLEEYSDYESPKSTEKQEETLKKNVDTKQLLKNKLNSKTSPYKPRTYKPNRLSPSPKRSDFVPQSPPKSPNVGQQHSNQSFGFDGLEQDYDLNQDFNSKMTFTRTQSMYVPSHHNSQMAPNVQGQMPYQGYHAGYQQPQPQYPSHVGYPQQMAGGHMPGYHQPANIGYNPMARETYSPDVKRNYYMQGHQLLDPATPQPQQQYAHFGWNEYAGHPRQPMPPQGHFNSNAGNPASANEIKMNFNQSETKSSTPMQRTSSGGTDSSGHKAPKDGSLNVSGECSDSKVTLPTLTEESCLKHAKDQSGCRMLQKRLEEGGSEEHANLYTLILPNFVELMNNPFGNYLCQKITEKCTKDQLKEIIEMIKPDVVKIC